MAVLRILFTAFSALEFVGNLAVRACRQPPLVESYVVLNYLPLLLYVALIKHTFERARICYRPIIVIRTVAEEVANLQSDGTSSDRNTVLALPYMRGFMGKYARNIRIVQTHVIVLISICKVRFGQSDLVAAWRPRPFPKQPLLQVNRVDIQAFPEISLEERFFRRTEPTKTIRIEESERVPADVTVRIQAATQTYRVTLQVPPRTRVIGSEVVVD